MDALTGWSTFFRRRGASWPWRLVYAYRAPTLFGAKFTEEGGSAIVASPDEYLLAVDFDGRRSRAADGFDLLYVAAHGRQRGGQFELLLHADEWHPAEAGLDGQGPRVVVFDACDFGVPADRDWADVWEKGIRPNLRMILGFGSLATVSKGTALRGEAFAGLLAGMPVAAAWETAVRGHDPASRDRPIALAFGKTAEEARSLLEYGTLASILAMPPLDSPPSLAWR